MKRLLSAIILAAVSCTAFISTQANAQVGVNIIIGSRPPPPRYERPPPPRVGYIWAPGYWNWSGGHHVWRQGYWDRARPGYQYQRPRWEQGNRGWQLNRGGWERGRGYDRRDHRGGGYRDHRNNGYDGRHDNRGNDRGPGGGRH